MKYLWQLVSIRSQCWFCVQQHLEMIANFIGNVWQQRHFQRLQLHPQQTIYHYFISVRYLSEFLLHLTIAGFFNTLNSFASLDNYCVTGIKMHNSHWSSEKIPSTSKCLSFGISYQTRSQAVARIADRTASQQNLVIIAIVLIGLAYYECISLI